MPRKKKKHNPKDLVNMDSTIKQLQSELSDPRVQTWLWRGAKGVRERVMTMNYDTLRKMSSQLPLVGGIINARQDQIRPYTRYAVEDGARGFRFEIENRTRDFQNEKIDEQEVIQLSTLVEQTGFAYDPLREDDFSDYVSMFVRDVYEIDQVATEIQRNRVGEAIAFWAVDGATIKRTTDENDFKKNIQFVQTLPDMEHDIVAKYTPDELIFDYMYKRSDIKYRGYGYSPIEQCINVITTLLFGYNYIRDQLVRDKMPKGFISVMGDVGKPQLDSIRNYWYSAMTGAGAQWNLPIIPSGKDGVGIDFKNLGFNNKDMEYHKTMMFVSSMVAAVFSIDLAELGIKTDDSTSLMGENTAPRLQSSKDRGLASMLSFLEQHINKVTRKVSTKYRFKFVGLEREDEKEKAEVRNKQIISWKSVDEVREEDGLKPFKEPWSEMILSPQAVQIYLADKAEAAQAAQQEAMDQQGAGEGEEMQGDEMSGDDQGDEETGEENEIDIEGLFNKSLPDIKSFKKLTNKLERKVHIIVE